MITFTSAQLDTWIATFLYPLARILALLVAAPIFNSAGLSTVVRLIFGLSQLKAQMLCVNGRKDGASNRQNHQADSCPKHRLRQANLWKKPKSAAPRRLLRCLLHSDPSQVLQEVFGHL
jgi:hypothetical protein